MNGLRVFCLVLLSSGATALNAQVAVGPVGSPQGGTEDYSINCPADEFLVGLRLRTGWYVDNIELICASFDAGGNTIIETLDTNNDGLINDIDDVHLTGGGEVTTTLSCPNNSVINQMGGREEAYVDALGAGCINTNGTGSTGLNITGGAGGSDFNLFCPTGQVVTGISGRSGWWIDSANFICEPLCLQTPPTVTLESPANGAEVAETGNVNFSWSTPGTGFLLGQGFQFCISSDAANGCDIVDSTTPEPNIVVPASSLSFNGAPLYWTVRAVNNCGEPGSFTEANIINPPGQGQVAVTGLDYRPLCSVYKDDRCSICHGGTTEVDHPGGEFPAQNDALARFDDDNCTACHSVVHPETNQNVWEFPPGAAEEVVGVDLQTFAGPATCGDICRTVRNWAEEHDFIHHIHVDPLVRYGFEPDTVQGSMASQLQNKPAVQAMNHDEYIDLSTSWYRAGMPCDPITNDFPSGIVSAAGNSNSGSNGGSSSGSEFDPTVLDKIVKPPEGELLWWIEPTKTRLKSNPPTNPAGLPKECIGLIRKPGRSVPNQLNELSKGKRETADAQLKKACLEIMDQLNR